MEPQGSLLYVKSPTPNPILTNNPHSPSITLPPTLFFYFVVYSFRIFHLQECTHLSHLPFTKHIHLFVHTKIKISFRAFQLTRLATRSPTPSMEITIRITNHVKAITWSDSTLFRNRLETWGQSITSQIPMAFRHRYKTQPVNNAVVNAVVNPSVYVGSGNIW